MNERPTGLLPRVVGTARARSTVIRRLARATVIAGLLAACWGITVAGVGTGRIAPHWFYVPILLAAAWFGHGGAFVASLTAAVLAGPLSPADTTTGTAQPASDWLTRGAFFVVVGQAMAWLSVGRQAAERALGETRRRLAGASYRVRVGDLEAERLHRVEEHIRRILDAGTIDIVFQPIANLRTGRVVGMEALSRFSIEPVRAPNLWFEDAHQIGLGPDLELLALRSAMQGAHHLPSDFFVSVNVSPQTIATQAFIDTLSTLPTEGLVIEATEHTRIDDYDVLLPTLEVIRSTGARLAVDDTGAGYASLRHILRLSPDLIKLDVELTRHIHDDPARRALAAGLIAFAWEVGAEIVAEGIERHEDLETLRDLGVSYGQGSFLARPSRLRVLDLSSLGPELRERVGNETR